MAINSTMNRVNNFLSAVSVAIIPQNTIRSSLGPVAMTSPEVMLRIGDYVL